MRSKIILTAFMAAAATSALLASAPAEAQERARGARFNFAPNYFRAEQPRVPNDYAAPSIKAGAVPAKSSFLLGGDPDLLAKAPAPPPMPTRPAVPQVTGRAFVPNTSFHPSFGQPIQALQAGAPVPLAQSMPAQIAPARASAPAAKSQPARRVARSSAPRHHASRAVSGKLITAKNPTGLSAPATYGNVGYIPGGHLPARSGYGTSVNTDVHGRIVKH